MLPSGADAGQYCRKDGCPILSVVTLYGGFLVSVKNAQLDRWLVDDKLLNRLLPVISRNLMHNFNLSLVSRDSNGCTEPNNPMRKKCAIVTVLMLCIGMALVQRVHRSLMARM